MRGILMDRRSVAKIFSNKYTKASKKMKSTILDDFTNLMGYNRTYAAYLLRNPKDIKPRIIVNKYYDKEVEKNLVHIWKIMDYICGQRLKPIIPDIIEKLEQFYEQSYTLELKEKLCKISSSTIDRILGPYKR